MVHSIHSIVRTALTIISMFFATATIAFSPTDFDIKLVNSKVLEVGYGSASIKLSAESAWKVSQDKAGDTYSYKGPLGIGHMALGIVDAQVGPAGVRLITSAGFKLGALTLSAGELGFQLLPGDQVKNQPDFLTFSKKDFVLAAQVSSGLSIEVGGSASFSIPSPADVEAALYVETVRGGLYYEGPMPSPLMLADGVNKFLKPASNKKGGGSLLTGGFGFSVPGEFQYASVNPLYQRSGKDPKTMTIDANVIIRGAFDLAEIAGVEGDFFIDTDNGAIGVNGLGSLGLDLFGAEASLEVGQGSFLVDRDGVRLGLNFDPSDSFKAPASLQNLIDFMLPMLGAKAEVYGTLKKKGDFILAIETEDVTLAGVGLKDAALSLSPKGMDVLAKMAVDGIGLPKIEGSITDKNCYVKIDDFRFLGFPLSGAKVDPCKAARQAGSGAVGFVGDISILGQTLSAVEGVSNPNDLMKAALSKDHSFKAGFDLREKFKVNGGLVGSSVRLTAKGTVNGTLSKEGRLSSALDIESEAKFCGKVKFAGKKTKKCKKTKSGISPKFDVAVGCFDFKAEQKILGEKLKIDTGKVCPWPSSGKYEPSDNGEPDGLDGDELALVAALQAANGNYLAFSLDGAKLVSATSSAVSENNAFTLSNLDGSQCPKHEATVTVRLGDGETPSSEHYMRIEDDKSTKLNGGSGDPNHNNKDKKRFKIYTVNGERECLKDGDLIWLQTKKYGRWWYIHESDKMLKAGNSKPTESAAFRIVLEPGWE